MKISGSLKDMWCVVLFWGIWDKKRMRVKYYQYYWLSWRHQRSCEQGYKLVSRTLWYHIFGLHPSIFWFSCSQSWASSFASFFFGRGARSYSVVLCLTHGERFLLLLARVGNLLGLVLVPLFHQMLLCNEMGLAGTVFWRKKELDHKIQRLPLYIFSREKLLNTSHI